MLKSLPKSEVLEFDGEKIAITRSSRKTLGLKLERDGSLSVHAPRKCSVADIKKFIIKESLWIAKHRAMIENINEKAENAGGQYTQAELETMKKQAAAWFPAKISEWASVMGVSYTHVTFRAMKGRWGSCSDRSRLCFNILLMKAPERIRESVIVHELAHVVEMNHSARFYNVIYSVFPDYGECDRWLKTEGKVLIRRFRGN